MVAKSSAEVSAPISEDVADWHAYADKNESSEVMEALFKEYAPTIYLSEKNDHVFGTVREIAMVDNGGEYGANLTLTLAIGKHLSHNLEGELVTFADGEEVTFWAMGSVVVDRLAELQPEVGERIAIAYLGRKLKKGGDPNEKTDNYHVFSIVMPDRPAPERVAFSWENVKRKKIEN